MKKHLVVLLTLVTALLLCLTACNNGTEPTETETPATSETVAETVADSETLAESDVPAESETVTETEGETEPPYELLLPGEVTPVDVYPTPIEVTYGEQFLNLACVNLQGDAAAYATRLEAMGSQISENGATISVEYRDLTELAYGAEEGYILTVNEEGVKIEAQTETGLHYAMVTLFQMMTEDATCPLVTVKDAPRNELRGVIEGFYGTAWTNDYRKELFAFMGDNKMNAYIYAPKDDAKHRHQWRVRYTVAELNRLAGLVDAAKENHVKFIFAISPGLDMDLGDGYERDFNKLVEKCQQVYDKGVRDFAIFLDDIPAENLDAQGHAKLLNDFQTQFVETHEGVSNLIAITPEYCDAFLTNYTNEIAPLIDEDIVLMWTGVGVSPFYNDNASLSNIVRKYNREVLIWWNYPVNDYATDNLFMDACGNLGNDIYETTTGLISNPMNQGYASMVPLFTISEFLWNPQAYDKTACLAAACERLMPDADEELLAFISMTCANVINNQTDSAECKTLLDTFRRGNTAENRAALKAYFEQMIQNADAIQASENQNMVAEMQDWLNKYRAYAEMGVAYMEMEEAYATGDTAAVQGYLEQYRAAQQSIANNTRIVSGNVLTPFFNNLENRLNTLAR